MGLNAKCSCCITYVNGVYLYLTEGFTSSYQSKRVVACPSTLGRSMLQGAPIVVGGVAIPCCMHSSRFSINTILRIRS